MTYSRKNRRSFTNFTCILQKPDAPHSSEQTVSDAQMASAYKPPHQRTTKYIPPSVRKEVCKLPNLEWTILMEEMLEASWRIIFLLEPIYKITKTCKI